ncbi:secreted phosphoprotein 24-like [Hemiscyllium ocellatum]|uniref:secreted phosphoprotein 24-like n=1 Tax=Hemiscyllium ocellatum TaxID=170820 RepID=UPI002965E730|nr:secreted phosphoprotein 24-like [Hemiscyllium ocellatum]
MHSFLLALVVLQTLRYSAGIPMTDFTPVVQDALKESILQLNRNTVSDYLLKATSNELLYITPTGPNEFAVDLRFTARETLCPKTGGFDSENCELNNDPLAKMTTCRSSVSYSYGAVVDVYLQCMDSRDTFMDSSSESASFESSEEVRYLRRRPPFQDEHHSSVDWEYQNNRQFPQRRGNGVAPRRPNKQAKPLSQGLSSRKKPNRKPNRDSKVE